ncbi:MFS transporter [Cellulomonas sp. S1-8]|uniref:MFS transporter n=1 Tax=Cellulomonas sp. S1-8 TaxID=2904790 RepID=UPI0022431BD6|nr:MFS transporter [Cellulomonas sp. S1-8]UZN03016.1 MFS transporter [Cellulomonas sp. S1-8]
MTGPDVPVAPRAGDPSAHAGDPAVRLDGLPVTRRHVRLLVGSGVGWMFDAMDVGLISFVIAQLAVVWGTDATSLGWVASAGFVGMAVGAALGGLLADRIGRRQVFALTLLVYGVATGASALAGSIAVLMALRFVVGLGLGAELPVASTLVSEFAPPRIRGRAVVLLESFWAVGWILAAVIGYLVVPVGDDGWRWALALGALPALYAVVVRRGLPESVRFLQAQGRHDEADRVVADLEASPALGHGGLTGAQVRDGAGGLPGVDADVPAGRPAAPASHGHTPAPAVDAADPAAADLAAADPAAAPVAAPPARARVADLWAPALRRRTTALWVVWFAVNFSYYGAFIWLPSLLAADGHTLVRSFGYTLIITLGQLPGYAAAAVLVETWGRRNTLAAFLAGSAVAAGLFAAASGDVQIVGAGLLLSFFNLGAWGALYAVTPELYPTRVRTTGAGWAAGIGRTASVLAPLAVPQLRELGGTTLLFTVFAAVFVVAALGATALPDHTGESLT